MRYAEREELAKVAYRAYGEIPEWKNFPPMPEWDDLGQAVQTAWIMAASAVRNHVLSPPTSGGNVTVWS